MDFLKKGFRLVLNAVLIVAILFSTQPFIIKKLKAVWPKSQDSQVNYATNIIVVLIASLILLILEYIWGKPRKTNASLNICKRHEFWEKEFEIRIEDLLSCNGRSKLAIILGIETYVKFVNTIIRKWIEGGHFIEIYVKPEPSNGYLFCQPVERPYNVTRDSAGVGIYIDVSNELTSLNHNVEKIENILVIQSEVRINEDCNEFNHYGKYTFKHSIEVISRTDGKRIKHPCRTWLLNAMVNLKVSNINMTIKNAS